MSNKSRRPRNLDSTPANAAAAARAQAAAYESVFSNQEMEINGEVFSIPPHPDFGLLDDDRMSEYEDLLFERDENYEREPDIVIPDQRLRDPDTGEETGVVLPGETQRGALKRPYRIKGEDGKSHLVKPPWNVKVVQLTLGESEYKRLKDAGGNASDVLRLWGKQGILARERQILDNKSLGSDVDLEAVSEGDS